MHTLGTEYSARPVVDHRQPDDREDVVNCSSQPVTIPAADLDSVAEHAIAVIWDMRSYRRMDVGILCPVQADLSLILKLYAVPDGVDFGDLTTGQMKQIATVTVNQSARYDEINSEALASVTATKNYRPARIVITVTPSAALTEGNDVELTVIRRW